MQTSAWIPVDARSVRRRGGHIRATRPLGSRLLAGATTGLLAVLSAVVLVPIAERVAPPILLALAPPTIPTTIAPVTAPTVDVTLPEAPLVLAESELAVLAGRAPLAGPIATVGAAFDPSGATAVAAAVDTGVALVDEALVVQPVPADAMECHERAAAMPLRDEYGRYDRNLVAQMTHTVFECVTAVGGLDLVAPSATRFWDAASTWGFENLAQQVAAESVVVSYCESLGFVSSSLRGNNPWGYGGLFQMGATEMRMFGFRGASKFDPVDNAYAAAEYFVAMYRRGAGWGGWGPWAVVNTGYNDEVNDRVKVPVLPRFTSTDPKYRGRRGAELPAWAVDPWSYVVPAWGGCPTTGRAWPAAVPLA